MTRAYLAFTEKGLALAQKLAGALPGTVDRCGHGGLALPIGLRSSSPMRMP